MAGPTYTPIELLARLVAFDTTSHKSNLGIVAFIEDYLLQHGVTSRRIVTAGRPEGCLVRDNRARSTCRRRALRAHRRRARRRANLDERSLHAAPGGRQALRARRLRYEGLSRLHARRRAGLQARALKTPIHLAFSYDEEVGCLGVRPMIAEFGKTLPTPRAVIVGEPTNMQVVDAHKGPVRWQVEVTGRAAHSSMSHLGVNAITYGARLIAELERIEAELKITSRNDHFVPPYATPAGDDAGGRHGQQHHPDLLPLRLRSAQPARRRCRRHRAAPAHLRTKAAACPRCTQIAPEAGIAITRVNTVPPFLAKQGSLALTLALQLTGQNETLHRLLRDRSRAVSGWRRALDRVRPGRHRAGAHGGRMARRKRDRKVHGRSCAASPTGRRPDPQHGRRALHERRSARQLRCKTLTWVNHAAPLFPAVPGEIGL